MKKVLAFLIFVLLLSLQTFAQVGKPYPIKELNTPDGDEYEPLITADGKTMYFCATDRDDNLGLEDIFVSHWENGHWSKPEVLTDICTADKNEAPLTVSTDGTTLIVFIDGNVYKTHKQADGHWSKPEPFEEVNYSDWNCDVNISADGNAILFSSGDSWKTSINIYVITKNEDGTWSEPQKLLETINKGDVNRTPFLSADMKTLYFSSDMEGGYGELDIYKATRTNLNSWTEWSEPINLGKNINTPDYDWAFKITTDGTKGYYNITIDDQEDIYMVDLPKNLQPEKVITLSGKILNTDGEPLYAEINWKNLETGEKLATLNSDPATGEYFITLTKGINYGIYVSKDGFYPVSYNLDLRGNIKNYNLHKDFTLKKIEKKIQGDVSIKFNNVFFETAKYDLKPESFPELNRLAEFIKQHPDIKVEIAGHTDNVGSVEYNLELSQKRANAVKEYLISKGVNPAQLIAKGYGESKPVATNATPEGRQQNRRVEFKILKNK